MKKTERLAKLSEALSVALCAWSRSKARKLYPEAAHEAREAGKDALACARQGRWKDALDAAHDAVSLEENITVFEKTWRTFLVVVQECAADAWRARSEKDASLRTQGNARQP